MSAMTRDVGDVPIPNLAGFLLLTRCRIHAAGSGGAGSACGRGFLRAIEQFSGIIWPETKLDESARVGDHLGLPAIIRLILDQGGLGARVPYAGRFAGQVFFPDQRLLDLHGPLWFDGLLAFFLP